MVVCSDPGMFDDVGFSSQRYEEALRFDAGDVIDADEWTDDEYFDWATSLTVDEGEVLDLYVGGLNEEFNALLRSGRSPFGGVYLEEDILAFEENIAVLQGAIDRAIVPDDLFVYRGSNIMSELAPGSVFHDPGFVSTSLKKETAEEFGSVVKILVPKGSKGAGLNATGRSFGEEYELLLQKGSTFKALGKDEDGVMVLMLIP